jgi:hypothetical protein
LGAAHRCRNVLRVIKRAFPLVDHARHTSGLPPGTRCDVLSRPHTRGTTLCMRPVCARAASRTDPPDSRRERYSWAIQSSKLRGWSYPVKLERAA